MTEEKENPFRPTATIDAQKHKRSMAYLFACLLWCGIAGKMIVLRPFIASIFEEFEFELPTITIWLMNPAQNLFFLAIAAGLLAAPLFVKTPEGRRIIGQRALILAFFVVLLLLLGIGIPLLRLMIALS